MTMLFKVVIMRTFPVMLGFVLLFLFCATIVCAADTGQPSKKMSDTEISVTDSLDYAPDELLVQFSSPQNDEKIAKKVETFYGKETKKSHKIVLDYSDLGLSNTYLLKLSAGEDPKEVKEKYKKDSEVVFAEPNYVVTLDVTTNDSYFSRLWGLHNTGQRGYADADIDAPEAWDLCTGSQEVIVAVIDSGVDYNHPDLAANIWTNSGEIPGNGKDDDGNGYVDDVCGWDFYNRDNNPMDDNNHGTHCAGTIGAIGNNGQGVTGVMWKVKIMPLKFVSSSGSGYTSDAVSAILYANKMGADIISNSWGGTGYSTTLKSAIDASSAVVVCAAGNSGTNNDNTPFYPASYTSPQIIAVAASTAYDSLASFSNYGSVSVDVAAPGDYIYSTIRGGSYGYMSGTSMATPHVAGLAGLVKAYSPGMASSQIKAAILGNVDTKSSFSGKVLTSGRMNAYRTLSSIRPPADLSVTGNEPATGYNTGPVFVTLTGTGFYTGTAVRLTGPSDIIGTGVTVVSEMKLTCTFDLTGQPEGSYDVVVNNPYGQSATYSGFTIIAPPPSLIITSLSPSSATVGDSGVDLTVTGSNFTQNSTVGWNGEGRTTVFVSGSQLRASISSGDIATAGTAIITVSDPDRITSNGMAFTIQPPPSLVITSLSPSSATVGDPGFDLTVTGSNFTQNSTVAWNGEGRTTVFVSGSQLRASISSGDIATAGTATITVSDPDRITSNGMAFKINSVLAVPVVSSVSPTTLKRGTSKSLTLYGSNFVSGAQAELRRTGYTPILCTREVVANSGKITCSIRIPSTTSTGYWDVAVINPDGQTGIKSRAVRIY